MNIPRPPTPPLPPEPGEFARVRRNAFIRKMRIPMAGATAVAVAAAVVLSVTPSPGHDQLTVATPTDSPLVTPSPEISELASPTPSTTETAPEPESTASATPLPADTSGIRWDAACNRLTTGPDITGTVVDEAGKPIPGILVSAAACGPVATDAHGHFRVACFDSGVYVAPYLWEGPTVVDHKNAKYGFTWIDDVIPVHIAGTPYVPVACGSNHRVVLPLASTVDVTALDENGHPLTNTQIAMGPYYPDTVQTFYVFDVFNTDSAGHVHFEGLPPGQYWFSTKPGIDPFEYLTISASGSTNTITYTRGTPGPSPSPTTTP